MDRKQKERCLDETARAWKAAAAGPGNKAAADKLRNDVFILAYELAENIDLNQTGQRSLGMASNFAEERDPSAFPDAIEEAMSKYDEKIGSFSHYFSMLLKKRSVDRYRYNARHSQAGESLDAPLSPYGENAGTLGDIIPAETDMEAEVERRDVVSSLIMEQTSLVLHFFQHHTGREANEARRMWYRLFYTEDITLVCKADPSILRHPRDVFLAMDLDYLDYYMSRICRTGMEIERTPPKPLCEIVSTSDDPSILWIDVKFPADVSLCFLLETTGKKPARSARSQQLTSYRKELNDLL